MKEIYKNTIKVLPRLKIVKENLSVAGVDGYISTTCESSRYEGGTVPWNACSDPTPGSICKLTGTVAVFAYTLTTTQIPFNSCHQKQLYF